MHVGLGVHLSGCLSVCLYFCLSNTMILPFPLSICVSYCVYQVSFRLDVQMSVCVLLCIVSLSIESVIVSHTIYVSGSLIAWRSDVTFRGSWITPDTGCAAAIFFPMLNFNLSRDDGRPRTCVQYLQWYLDGRSMHARVVLHSYSSVTLASAQRIQWNSMNGTAGACLYPWYDKDGGLV